MITHIDNHGPKYIIFISLVMLVALVYYDASNGQLNLINVIYDCIQMIFATAALMSGIFSFLVVMFTSATSWGAVAGFRTYVGIGALVELIVSVLFILEQFGIVNFT